jgi:hypothetical protein
MYQPTLNFNPLPKPGNLFSHGTQQYTLYSAFCNGPVTNIQMSILLGRTASHTRRMCDIDKRLEEKYPGEYVRTKKRIGKSVNEYRIIRLTEIATQKAA